ncbi:MAG: pyridoxal-phosphate dependent enzyme [Actinomycetota bacterium]|nr:pyridoxal-phosphate dependent enzyme [Actinomycetota bacterium]
MVDLAVTVRDICAVRPTVERFAEATPVRPCDGFSAVADAHVLLKLDNLQPTGSFKVRGAAARIGSLDGEARARGVITASTGNHGRAVAHVARRLGIPATVCLSENVPAGKVEALRRLGCRVDVGGASQDEALVRARAAASADGGPTLVHPFLDPVVVAGQGTCGLELAEQVPEVGTVLVPLSGGGLAAGVAVAVRSLRPTARIVGVSMDRGAAMHASLAAGHPVEVAEVDDSLADSLQGGIGLDNDVTFPIVAALVDEVVLVTEDEIAAGMRSALVDHRLVLEGAGAVGLAAILAEKVSADDRSPVVVVCSGANAELAQIARLATSP